MNNRRYKVYSGKRRSSRKWKWAVLCSLVGLVLVLGCVAGGYYLWLNAKVSAANQRVSQDVRDALADDATTDAGQGSNPQNLPDSPDAMNILILGSDTRSWEMEGSRSDTVILVHVDPANNYLSMLSLPRDLRVQVPGYGMRKLNYAFAKGGASLAIKTVQAITGVDIDHYLEVPFQAFTEMVDKLDGVYVEVDRRYFNDNGEWDAIDLQPGYQRLFGIEALDFCRFRHDSNLNFGRMERQQRFLNALRQQAMGWNLGLKLPGLIGAFFDNVATDLKTNDFLRLAWWAVRLDGERIRQVSLRGRGWNDLTSGVVLVYWKQADMDVAVNALLTPPAANTEVASDATVYQTTTTTSGTAPVIPTNATPSSIPDADNWAVVAKNVTFPVEAPSYVPELYRQVATGETIARIYGIKTGKTEQPALVMLYQNRRSSKVGEVQLQSEYINVTETVWLDAPAASPGRQVTYGGKVFTIVATAGKVDRIWWKSNGALYWVANSLSRVASESELLAMAESMIPIPAR